MEISRIALIETKAVKTHVFSRVYLPRLGLPIMSGLLKKNGYEVETFFQELAPLDMEVLSQFHVIGISSLTSTVSEAYKLGDELKQRGKTVVMGGPHVSAAADEAMEHCDYVVRGEGEITFLKLLDALKGNGRLEDVAGISYRENGESIHNPSSTEKVNLETLTETDFGSCRAFSGPEKYPTQVMFSRGCPYDCSFCSVTTTFGKKYRYKTTEQTIRDVDAFSGRTISFIDDNFAANPKRTKALLKTLIERDKIPLRYSCQLRINAAKDTELMELMKRTRCRVAYIGMESVNPETLKAYHKGQTLEEITAAIKVFRKYGIGIHGMFVLGADEDTAETIKNTVDFALDSGLDTIQLCALTPFPGTAVYDQMLGEGRILHQKWEYYDGLHVVIKPKKMTPYELQKGIIDGMERFYSLRNVMKISLKKRWRFKYRMAGRYLVNRWKQENAHYFEYLEKGSF